jgi:Pyruvate/2-oxoacid:ferredoxin oxidoreductase gamma subunit
MLSVDQKIWEDVIRERVPKKYADLNLNAFRKGRELVKVNHI